ncbi:MAG TPA: adenylate/guanylate cyclase domain-containing protein [Conexivisphaerales archaeon]|nr:adenylate/guanylate cyclase domain-containing protein [Conexivisphaerales archaeon]
MSKGERRLAAIMFTDMVGFTSLAQSNESLALKILERHRALLRPIFSRHHGREIKTMGDAFLVEFGSALEAARCAVEMQKSLHEYKGRAKDKPLVRIGIHVGDVVHRKGDIYGDAVNIASRIEPLSEGGSICVSEQTYDQIRNKVPYSFDKLESPSLKNIAFPVDVYVLRLPWQRRQAKPETGAPGPMISVLRSDSAQNAAGRREAMESFISKLALKDRIVDVRITNDPSIPEALARFSEGVDYGRGETLHIVSAVETVAVVIDSKNLERLSRFVPEKNVLGVLRGLAEIIVSFSESALYTVGVAATITGELARNGINILEYITSGDHAIVVVAEEQALKGYDALRKLLLKELPEYTPS